MLLHVPVAGMLILHICLLAFSHLLQSARLCCLLIRAGLEHLQLQSTQVILLAKIFTGLAFNGTSKHWMRAEALYCVHLRRGTGNQASS